MNITEASNASGLSVDTIRFYEKTGMLPPAPRDKRGWRNFGAEEVEWLRNLERLRATGMPLTDVRRFAVLVHTSDANDPEVAAERLAILQSHAGRLVERQRQLDACKIYLDHKISVYSKLAEPKS
jgi:MerR family transcriptional regulator, aldehyde-responsive regulator